METELGFFPESQVYEASTSELSSDWRLPTTLEEEHISKKTITFQTSKILDNIRISSKIIPSLEPRFKLDKKTEDVIPLNLSKEIKTRLIMDEDFSAIIGAIKFEMDKMSELENEECLIDISVKRDIEIPNWKTTVILIKIKNKTFEEIIELWRLIDYRLRNRINTIKRKYNKIEKINKSISIQVEAI